ncbi:MAG: hypothetical protein AAFQ80_14520 [Cyanobacteria bacterium J06621_8]
MKNSPRQPLLPLKLSWITIWQAISILLLFLIFLKAIIDIDTNYDTWWYHLPFAARVWGIVPVENFAPELVIQYRFEGFPLLANWFQGLLWWATGRVQAANLVGFFSVIIYLVFLQNRLQIPWYLGTLALLAIPTVFTHAATCFVDLPGNIGMSVLVIMTYIMFQKPEFPSRRDLIIMFFGAVTAVNTKPQLQPLAFLVCCIIAIRFVWLCFKQSAVTKKRLVRILPLALLASLLIFATPVKNIALHGNPFYPIKIEVAGVVLNHESVPEAYQEGNRARKWLSSVLEINTPPWWSTDQWNAGMEEFMDRGGGFFGLYVIFNILLLVSFCFSEQLRSGQSPTPKEARNALITVFLMSLVPANFPQSHELRYFMFWMISLVSLNLYLISRNHGWRWLQPKYLGLIYLIFQLVVQYKAGRFYGKPVLISLEKHLSNTVRPELLTQIPPNSQICLKSQHGISNEDQVPFVPIQNTFLYSSYFHPELDYDYSITAAVDPINCGDRQILPRD